MLNPSCPIRTAYVALRGPIRSISKRSEVKLLPVFDSKTDGRVRLGFGNRVHLQGPEQSPSLTALAFKAHYGSL